MFKRKKDIIVVVIVAALFVLISYPLNNWLCTTMPRHQLIQLPAMFGLGVILGINLSRLNIKDTSWGLAILICIMTSFIFWMLPHSIDYAVINKTFNRIMHFNMVIAGVLLIAVLRSIILEIKIIFLGMLSAMLLATGITLRAFNILLCSSFSIDQQKETGLYLIIAGSLLFIFTFVIFFKASGKSE